MAAGELIVHGARAQRGGKSPVAPMTQPLLVLLTDAGDMASQATPQLPADGFPLARAWLSALPGAARALGGDGSGRG